MNNIWLDHVAVVVDNLERANSTFSRMGFALSAQSSHKIPARTGDGMETLGTGNHCAMFEQGYFEVLGVTDPSLPNESVTELLANYAGLHLVALGCKDAGVTATSLRQRLGSNPAPYLVGRDIPLSNGGVAPGSFNILPLADDEFVEADLFFIEHLTSETLWQPDMIAQKNGVTALLSVIICAENPTDASARMSKILNLTPQTSQSGQTFDLGQGQIQITDRDWLANEFCGVVPPTDNWVAASRFLVKDLSKTASYLRENGFNIQESNPREFWIGPDQAEGAIMVFCDSER